MGCVSCKSDSERRDVYSTKSPQTSALDGANGVTLTNGAAGGTAAGDIVVDARLPLNNREIFKLKSSWKAIHRNTMETGVELFISLFKQDPELRQFFSLHTKISADADLHELRESEALQNHAETVMKLLDETILNIDNVEKIIIDLQSAAARHKRFQGFQASFFGKFESPILDAVKIILDDRFSDSMAEIYKKTVFFILSTMEEGFLLANM